MGIRDDAVLAAVLLHDVVEDTEYTLEELPFSDEVKELVNLLTHVKGQGNEEYFGRIAKNGKACLIKVLDRCNNVSTMAASFSREKLISYIEETETYILPLADILKHEYPVYGDAAFILKYQIIALIETMKNLLAG
jgi:(p)ppGpp synthase/HD superfamily hydrolase